MARTAPSSDEVLEYFTTLSNWGRWGDDDEAGTLNLITPEVVRSATALVTDGVVVSCSLPIKTDPTPDEILGTPQRHMLVTGEAAHPDDPVGQKAWGPMEYFGLAFHGFTVTHIDALCHSTWEGQMYNGRPVDLVTARSGALVHDVLAARDGIVTRGVILDIPAVRGTEWLEPGDGVFPEDLDAAAEAQGVEIRPGDAVLLRTGYGLKRARHGHEDMLSVGQSGWHTACMPWLREKDVAIIGSDTSQEVVPSGYDNPVLPVHVVGIVAMGLWLIDNLDLEAAHAACTERGRWEFCLNVHPLLITGGTGSPVNPVAVF